MKKTDMLAFIASTAAAYIKDAKQLEAFNAKITEKLGPKNRGVKANPEEYVKKDNNGKVTHILCSKSGVWLPAADEFFYPDLKGDGILGTGLKRLSRLGEKYSKSVVKELKDEKNKITEAIIANSIALPEAQKQLKELENVDVKAKVKEVVEKAAKKLQEAKKELIKVAPIKAAKKA